jgi:hypothetical protein
MLNLPEIDVSVIRGPDRRVTRLASGWAYTQPGEHGRPRYAGIRYSSGIDSRWECWAVFDRTPLQELERMPIERTNPALERVALERNMTVF